MLCRARHFTTRTHLPKSNIFVPPLFTTPAEDLQRKALESVQKLEWVPTDQRVGAIAIKKGMMSLWDQWGCHIPVTVLQLEDTLVLGRKTQQTHGYDALIVGCKRLEISSKNDLEKYRFNIEVCQRASLGFCLEKIAEFRVSPGGFLPIGFPINAAHFVCGQYIDAQSRTIDKGFQGVMKRHGFKGQSASHGTSLSHRSPGSIGQRKDPGKVWKGRKMPGHMGNEMLTVMGLQVVKIDRNLNLVYVKGSVPGKNGSFVKIRDSIWHKDFFDPYKNPPPFPTITAQDMMSLDYEILMEKPTVDPISKSFNLN